MISVLFGAGASWDSERYAPRPPLGKDLFSELNDLDGRYSKLSDVQKKEFKSGGFEVGMCFIPNDSEIINPLQIELALFLSKYEPTSDGAYVRLFKMLGSLRRKINILTLNYDLLIEKSLLLCGDKEVSYDEVQDTASVLKVHGSCNFVPDVHPGINIGKIVSVDCGTFVDTDRVRILQSHGDLESWSKSHHGKSFSPVMCLFNKEKRVVMNSSIIEGLKARYSSVIKQSRYVFIVGVNYVPHDSHVWDCIFDSGAELIIVDPYPSEIFISVLKDKNINHILIKKGFYDSVKRLAGMIRVRMGK
ncbi:hypothetical protein RJE46_10750 [Cedecea neteri]|uniref:hypothetical protein n=1 Tax=Cedecea neteri TaxID=158822 RepID=UPI0028931ADE|nr:hypothetical protein [Cedecea neteri]WNJ81674.1 hypothetical protein RJE46_10750 [Cedecea neteri]